MIDPRTLSDFEILMLARQQQILAKLDYIIQEQKLTPFEGLENDAIGILQGYEIPDLSLDRSDWLNDAEKSECELIMDVFWNLYFLATNKNAPASFADLVKFPGFDKNDDKETQYHQYGEWMIRNDQYESLAPLARSHMERLPTYRRLIEELDTKGYLTVGTRVLKFPHNPTQVHFDELTEILKS